MSFWLKKKVRKIVPTFWKTVFIHSSSVCEELTMCQALYKIIETHYKIRKYICPLWWLILQVNLTGLRCTPKLVTWSFGICWRSCLWKRLASGLINWVKVTLTSAVGIIQATEGLNRTRSWRKGKFALFRKLGHTFSPVLDISTPGSQAFELKMRLTVSFSCSQSFELIVNYTMRFLGAPAWRQLIMEFLSLHNGMSKFL